MLYDNLTRRYYKEEELRRALVLLDIENASAGLATGLTQCMPEANRFGFSLAKLTPFGTMLAEQEDTGMAMLLGCTYEGEHQLIDLVYVAPKEDNCQLLSCNVFEDMDTEDASRTLLFADHGKLQIN